MSVCTSPLERVWDMADKLVKVDYTDKQSEWWDEFYCIQEQLIAMLLGLDEVKR